MNCWYCKEHKTYAWCVFKITLLYIDQQLKSTKVVWWTSKKSFVFRCYHCDNLLEAFHKRIFSMSIKQLLWTLGADLCISKTYHAYVLCSLQYQQFIGINLTRTACIFSVLIKKKAILKILSKWSVESFQNILSFWLFFAKFLTLEPCRKFSHIHVMVVFWVPYVFSQISAIQRTLNLGDTTSRKYPAPIFEKTVTSPAFSILLLYIRFRFPRGFFAFEKKGQNFDTLREKVVHSMTKSFE